MTKTKILLLTSFLFLFVSTGCQQQLVKESGFHRAGKKTAGDSPNKNVSLVCWNVQTFFDAVTSGTEYKEFKNSERWNKEKYIKRLEKLCDLMKTLNPDIFVMEEIENEAVVQDIVNTLAGNSWDQKKSWKYTCFVKESGSAIGCAVFSRYELSRLRTHSLDIRTQTEEQPSSRPLMELSVFIGDKELELFVNHWKSKSGGEEETEIWRDWQELVLAEAAMSVEPMPLVICGDFNRSAEDFILLQNDKKENVSLRGQEKSFAIYSPWFRSDGKFSTDKGSYFYNNEWERIDNIFIAGDVSVQSFCPVADAPLADEEGIPIPYKLYSGEGYSDHLPLKCVLTI